MLTTIPNTSEINLSLRFKPNESGFKVTLTSWPPHMVLELKEMTCAESTLLTLNDSLNVNCCCFRASDLDALGDHSFVSGFIRK